MSRDFPVVALACASIIAAATSPARQTQGVASIRDSAGIRIVTNAASPTATTSLRIDPTPIYRLGFSDRDYLFTEISGAALFSDGSAVIANRGQTRQLVVLTPTGGVRTTLGRAGQGPGEFEYPKDPIVIEGDTILVTDPMRQKIMLFHGNRVVREMDVGQLGILQALGTNQRSLLMGPWLGYVMGRLFPTPWLSVPLVSYHLNTGRADTVAAADQEQSLNFNGRNPFKSQGAVVASRGMFVVGRSDSPELRFIDATGRLRQIARWQATKSAVHDTIWRNYSTRYGKALRERKEQPMTEDLVLRFVGPQVKEGIKEPLPFFGPVLSDPDGNVWIGDFAPRYNADPPRSEGVSKRFRVMSPSGQWVTEVRIPNTPHFREYYREVLAIGKDRILLREVDSLGVIGVAAYKLLR